MRVSELIELLSELPPQHQILLQKDSEGNAYRHPTGACVSYTTSLDFEEYEPEFVYDDPDGEPENYMELVIIW